MLLLLTVVFAGMLAQRPASALPLSPSYAQDFPDPSVITDHGTYWAYATGSAGRNLQVISSPDLARWSPPTDPLPTLPTWAVAGRTWAPSVIRVGARLLMYYTVRDSVSGRQCISVASAPSPSGPFSDPSHQPLICQLSLGGSIDPQVFAATGGGLYLDWKSDDNALGNRTSLWAEQLTPDGRSLIGPGPRQRLTADSPWQGGIIEGPSMTILGGRTYLLYSGNDYASRNYALGYATCNGPLGPCRNASVTGPWFSSANRPEGPGGPTVFADLSGTSRIGYNTWSNGTVGYPAGVRGLWINPLALATDPLQRWTPARRRLTTPSLTVLGAG